MVGYHAANYILPVNERVGRCRVFELVTAMLPLRTAAALLLLAGVCSGERPNGLLLLREQRPRRRHCPPRARLAKSMGCVKEQLLARSARYKGGKLINV